MSVAGIKIFNFHVDEVKPATTPEEIAEWEEFMQSRVRMAGFDMSAFKGARLSTTCCSGTCDDCGAEL